MSMYAVMMKFLANDRDVLQSYSKMEHAAKKYGDTASGAMDKVGRHATHASAALRNASKHGYNFTAIVKGILAANAIRGGVGMVGSGFAKLTNDFLSFDDTIIGAAARFKDIGPGAKDAAGAIERLSRATRGSIAGSRFSAVDAAKTMNELAKADYSSTSALGIMPNLLAFATAAQEDLAEATTMSSDILGAFGMRSEDTQKQLKNHIRLNDMLTKSSLLSTGGLRDLYETLQQTAPLSKELKMLPEELLSLSVVLSNAGIKGTEAATAIKRATMQIYAGNMTEEFAANGINVFDPDTGEMKKINILLGEIGTKLKKLSDAERVPILRKIFGMYGFAGSVKLMNDLEAAGRYQREIADAPNDNTTQKVAAMQNTSTIAKLMDLANTALEKGFQILERFNKNGQKGIEGITERIRNFKVEPLITAFHAIGSVFRSVWKIVEPLLPAMPYLLGLWAAFATGQKILAGVKFLDEVHKMAKGVGMIEKVLGAGTMVGKIRALGGALLTVSTPLIAMAAAVSTIAASKSAFTGQDNFISQIAQNMGLVPKLEAGPDGRVGPGLFEGWGGGVSPYDAPNAQTAEAKRELEQRLRASMRVEFANAPQGMKVNGQPVTPANPWVQMQMLGVNP